MQGTVTSFVINKDQRSLEMISVVNTSYLTPMISSTLCVDYTRIHDSHLNWTKFNTRQMDIVLQLIIRQLRWSRIVNLIQPQSDKPQLLA